MYPKTARMALAGYLAIGLARGSLSSASSPQKKIADLEFSGALSEADQKYEENQGEINLTGRAGRDMAGPSAVSSPTEGEAFPWISKPF